MKAKQIAALLLIGTLTLTGCAGQVGMTSSNTATQTDAAQQEAESAQTETEEAKEQGENRNGAASGMENSVETVQADNSYTTAGINVNLIGDYSDKALSAEWSLADSTVITCSDAAVTIDGDGAVAKDGVITITAKGTYVFEGSLSSGQIVVDAEDKNVTLVFDGFSITNQQDAPIYVKQAKNVYVTLADGTENAVIDSRSAVSAGNASSQTSDLEEEEECTAAIYSKDDLIINGNGTLYVKGGYKDGITGKDDLQIISGTITIEAADDGIVGKDSVSIKGGSIVIDAGDDGIKSTNEDTEKGYLVVDGGSIQITSGSKGIDAVNVIVVNDGAIYIDAKKEGMEALNVVINGGDVSVKAEDDGINIASGSGSAQTGSAQMPGGTDNAQAPQMPGGTDNAQAPQMPGGTDNAQAPQIPGGTDNVQAPQMPGGTDDTQNGPRGRMQRGNAQNGERPRGGFGRTQNGASSDGNMPQIPNEGNTNTPNDNPLSDGPVTGGQTLGMRENDAQNIDVSTGDGGVINRTADDVASTENMQNLRGGMMGQGRGRGFGGMDQAIDGALVINGGTVTVDAGGDGLDSNGDIQINGGYTIVSGTKSGGNGALDYNGTCEINGGVLLLTSSGDMEQRGSTGSGQKMAYANLNSMLPAGSEIQILGSDGSVLYTFTNAKECRYVAVSAPEVTENASIQIRAGGTAVTASIG